MGDFLLSVHASDLIERRDLRGKTSVDTKHFFVDDRTQTVLLLSFGEEKKWGKAIKEDSENKR